MAIAFDSISTPNQVSTATNTFAFNNVAGNTMLVCGHEGAVDVSVATGVTYAGTALVKVGGVRNGTGRHITMWRWDNTAHGACPTGSNNVVVTHSIAVANNRYFAVSYSGADNADAAGASDTTVTAGSTSTVAVDVTTTATNSWIVVFGKDNSGSRTYSTSLGTMRLNTDAGGLALADSGNIASISSNTITLTDTGGATTDKSAIALEILVVPSAATFTPRVSFFM